MRFLRGFGGLRRSASGASGAAPKRTGGFWRRLGNSLKSSDLEGSIAVPKTEKGSPNCVDDARIRRA